MSGKKIWAILTDQSWSFCKYLPESGVLIQGQAVVEPVAGKANHKKWREEGSWFGNNDKSYACSLVHEYVFEGDRICIYSGPDTKTLLHEFVLKPFKKFPFAMQHTHLCGQDSYDCTWVFLSNTSFEMQYTVLGPKKNYHIQALYTGNMPKL